ncbi:MAG: hypothetical protein ACO1TE_12865 [Prosthecobacter sp.]
MTNRSKILALLGWGLVAGAVVLLSLVRFVPSQSSLHANQGRTIANCRKIIIALKVYASQNGSAYPYGRPPWVTSSNQTFRKLFDYDIGVDERVFESPAGPFKADNVIGSAPDFAEALKPGECHWMILQGQTDTSIGKMPLLIENALNSSWPPRWDVSGNAEGQKGRCWRDRTVIIGRNDGTVTVEKLREDGTLDWHSPPNLFENGKSWIDYLTPEQVANLEYLDVEDANTNQYHAARP